jgi:hypothetical protein
VKVFFTDSNHVKPLKINLLAMWCANQTQKRIFRLPTTNKMLLLDMAIFIPSAIKIEGKISKIK